MSVCYNMYSKCRRRDLNPQPARGQLPKLLRLPVSPRRHSEKLLVGLGDNFHLRENLSPSPLSYEDSPVKSSHFKAAVSFHHLLWHKWTCAIKHQLNFLKGTRVAFASSCQAFYFFIHQPHDCIINRTLF